MSSVLEILSLNELLTRKKNLLYQLNKVEHQIEKIKKNNHEDEQCIKKIKIKINIKKG
jgi:uncharacterized alpha-E superfamily protein